MWRVRLQALQRTGKNPPKMKKYGGLDCLLIFSAHERKLFKKKKLYKKNFHLMLKAAKRKWLNFYAGRNSIKAGNWDSSIWICRISSVISCTKLEGDSLLFSTDSAYLEDDTTLLKQQGAREEFELLVTLLKQQKISHAYKVFATPFRQDKWDGLAWRTAQ